MANKIFQKKIKADSPSEKVNRFCDSNTVAFGLGSGILTIRPSTLTDIGV